MTMKPSNDKDGHGLVSILVPAKDEEAAIASTLQSLPIETLRLSGFEVEIIILDGKSRDATRDLAYEFGGATVVFEKGSGKGHAIKDARAFIHGDYVVMLDGDGSYPPDALPRILAPLVWNEAEVVMGRRNPQPGAMSLLHRLGNLVLSLCARGLYHQPCPDLCTGMWGFKTEAFESLPLQNCGFELEAELFSLSSRLGHRIKHVPIDYLPRKGMSKITMKDGVSIIFWLLQRRLQPVQRRVAPPRPTSSPMLPYTKGPGAEPPQLWREDETMQFAKHAKRQKDPRTSFESEIAARQTTWPRSPVWEHDPLAKIK